MCTCQASVGPPCVDETQCQNADSRGQVWDRGARAGGASGLGALGKGNQGASFSALADSGYSESANASERQLRCVLQAVGGDSCLGERAALDIAGNSFRIPLWRLRFVAVIQVIRSETSESHVRAPGVVPAFEFGAQGREVVKPLDDRYTAEPLVFEGLDHPLGDSDRAVFPYSTEARFDVPLFQQCRESISDKDTGLVRDHVFRCPMLSHSLLQSLDDPAGVGSFQRSDADDLAGEVVDN